MGGGGDYIEEFFLKALFIVANMKGSNILLFRLV